MNRLIRGHILAIAGTIGVLTETGTFAQHHGHVGGGGGTGGGAVATHHSSNSVSQHVPAGGHLQANGQAVISRNLSQGTSTTTSILQSNSHNGLTNQLGASSGGRGLNNISQNGAKNHLPNAMGIGSQSSSRLSQKNVPPSMMARTSQLTSTLGAKNLPPVATGRASSLSHLAGAKNLPPTVVNQTNVGNKIGNGSVVQKSNKIAYSSSKNLSLDDLAKNHQSTQLNGAGSNNPKGQLSHLGTGTVSQQKNHLPHQVASLSPHNKIMPGGSGSGGSGSGGSGSGGSGSGGSGSGGSGSGGSGSGGSGSGGSGSGGQCGMNSLQILSTYLVVPVGGIPFGGYGGYGSGYGPNYYYDPLAAVGGDPSVMSSSTVSSGGPVGYPPPGGADLSSANIATASVNASPIVPSVPNTAGSATTGGRIVLMLAASAGGSLNFGIDGIEQTIAAGSANTFALPNGTKGEIDFENGTGTNHRYTLTSGETYEFYARDGAWDLRQKASSGPKPAEFVAQGQIQLMHFSSDAPPVSFLINGEMNSIASGATKSVGLPNAEKAEISFDNGTGVPTRYTIANGQSYEFFARDGAWDLREKAIPSEQTLEKQRLITGRFAVINPAENNIPLSFKLNGEAQTVTAGDFQIITTFDNEVPQVAVAGPDGREAEVPVAAGRIYEFWDNEGVWNLREKVIAASDTNANAAEDAKI